MKDLIMKNTTIRMTAMVLTLFVGTVAAQQTDFPTRCPPLPSQKSTAKKDTPKTSEQATADKLVAEAQTAMRSLSRENVAKAISLAEQALKSEPNDVAAYLVLARAHAVSQRYSDVPKKVAMQRAWENLSKARALDPANIEGLQLLADQIVARNHDYDCAKQILETALKFDPQNARTNYFYSQVLGGMGNFDLAFQYADKAISVADADSRNFVVINAGRLRYMAGEYDWVLAHYAKYLESNPNNWLAHFYRSLAFGAKGQFEQALIEAIKAMPDAPSGDAGGIGMLALAYANAGQKEQARELLNELLRRDARGEHVVEYRIAAVYEVLGERDEAFRWLGREIDDRDGLGSWLVWIKHDPVWKEARTDLRFKEIQERAGWKN
jgi:tetratricopeptide (TPR) repeat protein